MDTSDFELPEDLRGIAVKDAPRLAYRIGMIDVTRKLIVENISRGDDDGEWAAALNLIDIEREMRVRQLREVVEEEEFAEEALRDMEFLAGEREEEDGDH